MKNNTCKSNENICKYNNLRIITPKHLTSCQYPLNGNRFYYFVAAKSHSKNIAQHDSQTQVIANKEAKVKLKNRKLIEQVMIKINKRRRNEKVVPMECVVNEVLRCPIVYDDLCIFYFFTQLANMTAEIYRNRLIVISFCCFV